MSLETGANDSVSVVQGEASVLLLWPVLYIDLENAKYCTIQIFLHAYYTLGAYINTRLYGM